MSSIWILLPVLLFAFYLSYKKDIFDSISLTLLFIFALWLNVPVFIDSANLKQIDQIFLLQFKLYDYNKILYAIVSNLALSVVLYMQSRISNRTEFRHFEVKRDYDKFGEDAVTLFVIGKDLDFLGKKTGYIDNYKKQIDRIEHLKSHCKLICQPTEEQDLLEIYKRFEKNGGEIRFYKKDDKNIDSSLNLKGQIKVDQEGVKKAILTSKHNNRYHMMKTENQFLVETIIKKWNEVSEEVEICTEIGESACVSRLIAKKKNSSISKLPAGEGNKAC